MIPIPPNHWVWLLQRRIPSGRVSISLRTEAQISTSGKRTDKNKIVSSLKEITVPFLRKIGFKGSFPNF